MKNISLKRALSENLLPEFVAQEEARGVVSDRTAFERTIGAAVKPPQSEDQTLHSASRDDSSGK